MITSRLKEMSRVQSAITLSFFIMQEDYPDNNYIYYARNPCTSIPNTAQTLFLFPIDVIIPFASNILLKDRGKGGRQIYSIVRKDMDNQRYREYLVFSGYFFVIFSFKVSLVFIVVIIVGLYFRLLLLFIFHNVRKVISDI